MAVSYRTKTSSLDLSLPISAGYEYSDISDGVYYSDEDMDVDVDVENQYYNSKGTRLTSPQLMN